MTYVLLFKKYIYSFLFIVYIYILLIANKLLIIGCGIIEGEFTRIRTTAAALWKQMMRIPEILTIIKQNKHSKIQSGKVLLSQLRDYHTNQFSYDTSYICNVDTSIKWWQTCQMKPPYL